MIWCEPVSIKRAEAMQGFGFIEPVELPSDGIEPGTTDLPNSVDDSGTYTSGGCPPGGCP